MSAPLTSGAKTSEGVLSGVFAVIMSAVAVVVPQLTTLPTPVQIAVVAAAGVTVVTYVVCRTLLKVATLHAASASKKSGP